MIRAFDDEDFEVMGKLLAPDFRYHQNGKVEEGADGFRAMMRRVYAASPRSGAPAMTSCASSRSGCESSDRRDRSPIARRPARRTDIPTEGSWYMLSRCVRSGRWTTWA
ncbi:MAG: nuclear transport factor 2 family protein [Chloroflexi bacterium]|nr:MAG: nuclear transport factor 2 family protein [Chloroflexota bacterium]